MVRIPYIKIPSVRVRCIGPASNIGTGGATPAPPAPITYLTQWKIVGNSEVHIDPYLTSWKVSGNSVVDNNVILSCGDLGQDGKYHVKISNGVNVYDIPLTAPLRKVNDVADSIEFPSGTEGKALVTRNLSSILIGNATLFAVSTNTTDVKRIRFNDISAKPVTSNSQVANILCCAFEAKPANIVYVCSKGISVDTNSKIHIYDPDYNTASDINDFKAAYADVEIVYELAIPTTELVDAPQIAVSPTDTYTSANETPYSAFEHTKHSEIWSCGEYNAVDGKYHILVQPQGGSIANIALTEPLRKVNDVADTIEFPSETEGKALVTRRIGSEWLQNLTYKFSVYSNMLVSSVINNIALASFDKLFNGIVEGFTTYTYNTLNVNKYSLGAAFSPSGTTTRLCLYDPSFYEGTKVLQEFYNYISDKKCIFELATPTTELVDAPQIQEADSYTMVISQGGKAVSWSEFLDTLNYLLTDSENNILVDSKNYQLTVQS